MSVVSKSEAGYRGYLVTETRYGQRQMDRWRRMGGRPRNKTLAEIRALPGHEARSTSRQSKGGSSIERRAQV